MTPTLPDGHRDGQTYEAEFDYERLNGQMRLVYWAMSDQRWHTLSDIAVETGFPEASISARLRDLRKKRFGGFTIERERHPKIKGLFLYRLTRAEAEAA